MDPFPVRRIMEEDVLSDVTVTDVYDQAAGIGKEFEKLIESYGVESVTDLMPKVIRALEQLEALAGKYEKESNEISDLRFAVDKLECEKADKNQERQRFEEELIQIEEQWQKESKEQLSLIARLQEENRRLKDRVVETKQSVVEEKAAIVKKTEEKEIEVLTKLKETVDRQRDELRKYSREVKQKQVDIEALQAQSERLVKINIELRRKNQTHRKQARTLYTDKADLESQLAEKEQQVTHVQELLKEQETVEEHAAEKSNPANADSSQQQSVEGATVMTVKEGGEGENPEHLIHKLNSIGKVIWDKEDPNRPRFTLNELRTVLMERNELKAQLLEVEEELDTLKPNSMEEGDDEYVTIDDNTNAIADEMNNIPEEENEEDLPVQGPINKEPDEKLYPGRRQGGIRKFFGTVMSSLENISSSRSFSSLFGDSPTKKRGMTE